MKIDKGRHIDCACCSGNTEAPSDIEYGDNELFIAVCGRCAASITATGLMAMDVPEFMAKTVGASVFESITDNGVSPDLARHVAIFSS